MRIAVLVRSPHSEPGSRETLPGLSPGDRAALATAVGVAREGDEVVALTAGPAEDEQALAAALRGGAHRAVRITDPLVKDADQRTAATILAGGLRVVGFDLILTGQRSVDWSTGGTGPGVAHMLRLPHVTSVSRVERVENSDDELTLRHRRGQHLHELSVRLPALLTILEGPTGRVPSTPTSKDLPAIEGVSLAEVTLPFRKPLITGDRVILPVDEGPPMLDRIDGLLDLINRWR